MIKRNSSIIFYVIKEEVCMSEKLEWQERFNIGVDSIDKDHRQLFSIMNKLLSMSEHESKIEWVGREGIKYFKNHVMEHFAKEEEYMNSINFEGYPMHKRLHDNFKAKTLPALEEELVEGNFSLDAVRHFLGVCIGWMTAHTLTEDSTITGKVKSKWDNLPSEEVITALEQTIIKTVNDMFKLETRVVSDHYGAEDFGKGFYYKLVYSSEQGKKWDVILIFEEVLLTSTVGQMLGIRFDKIDDLIINATRYITLQFMDCIKSSFPSLGLFNLEKEHLLTYEQFSKEFNEQTPECSLLFNTGEGYFGFCILSPDASGGELGLTLNPRNVTSEIKKYLDKGKTTEKEQILIVDDSDVVQHAMKMLLGSDYDVVLANSASAALKCIARNRPDLILLDYEMPICDGRQTLEMIRSEEETADIPVIFLTGRGDKESVKNVMSLKATGYMLKTMKPEEIKKVIDNYFKQRKKK